MPWVCAYWPVRKLARLRRAERRRDEGVAEDDAFAGDAVDVRRLDERMAGEAQVVPAQIVNQDEDDVGTGVARHTSGTLVHSGEGNGQQQSEHGNS